MNVTVSITSYGKQKAEDITGKGLKYRVLSKLYEQGTMSSEELAAELGVSNIRMTMIINALLREGKVREE